MNRIAIRNFTVGLFVLGGMGCIAYLSFSVGGWEPSKLDSITLKAPFDEIGGLNTRAPVVIAGVRVGEVTKIVLDEDYRAEVHIEVDASLEYSIDTSASIVTSGVLGDNYISLEPGGDDELLVDGDRIYITESAMILEDLIGNFVHNVSLDED